MFLITASLFNVILVGVFLGLIIALMKKPSQATLKTSPFECGFESLDDGKTPLSVQFFLMALVFLMFDVELILLFPLLLLMSTVNSQSVGLVFAVVISVIVFTTMMEWNMKSLDWAS